MSSGSTAGQPLGYLDHSASTPLRPEAFEAMVPWLRDHPANPSGAHRRARDARRAIDDAREQVAAALGADPAEVVFTSGGTEADNLAVLGSHDRRGGVVVCAATEHHAVLEPVHSRGGSVVPVHPSGVIDLDALTAVLDGVSRPDRDQDHDHDGGPGSVTLVSVMLANNEVGTVQPVAEVAAVVRDRAPGASVHTDAVQALTWLDVAARAAAADLVSVSAHKFGGPKGVGALVVRGDTPLAARQIGGGQERERRSGTQNVAAIVGMGVAAELAVASRSATVARAGALRDRLQAGLTAAIGDAVVTGTVDGSRPEVVAGTCHLCLPGVESEALLFLIEQEGISASAAASCASGAMEPSHVLAAMGVERNLAFGSLRLTLGWSSTEADVDLALMVIPPAVARLRSFSGSISGSQATSTVPS